MGDFTLTYSKFIKKNDFSLQRCLSIMLSVGLREKTDITITILWTRSDYYIMFILELVEGYTPTTNNIIKWRIFIRVRFSILILLKLSNHLFIFFFFYNKTFRFITNWFDFETLKNAVKKVQNVSIDYIEYHIIMIYYYLNCGNIMF